MKPDKVMLQGGLRFRLAIAAVALVAAGCVGDPFALSSEAVDDHRARWNAAGIVDYEFDYRRQCECLPASTRPARVEVRGGRVAGARYNDSGELANALGGYPTIDELFDFIDEAITNDATMLLVSYDSRLGYPTEISIDYDPQAVDDEVTIKVENLVAAPDPGILADRVAG